MPFFFEQNMQDVWSLPLSCLLVCCQARPGENYGFLDYKEDRYTTVYGYMD